MVTIHKLTNDENVIKVCEERQRNSRAHSKLISKKETLSNVRNA